MYSSIITKFVMKAWSAFANVAEAKCVHVSLNKRWKQRLFTMWSSWNAAVRSERNIITIAEDATLLHQSLGMMMNSAARSFVTQRLKFQVHRMLSSWFCTAATLRHGRLLDDLQQDVVHVTERASSFSGQLGLCANLLMDSRSYVKHTASRVTTMLLSRLDMGLTKMSLCAWRSACVCASEDSDICGQLVCSAEVTLIVAALVRTFTAWSCQLPSRRDALLLSALRSSMSACQDRDQLHCEWLQSRSDLHRAWAWARCKEQSRSIQCGNRLKKASEQTALRIAMMKWQNVLRMRLSQKRSALSFSRWCDYGRGGLLMNSMWLKRVICAWHSVICSRVQEEHAGAIKRTWVEVHTQWRAESDIRKAWMAWGTYVFAWGMQQQWQVCLVAVSGRISNALYSVLMRSAYLIWQNMAHFTYKQRLEKVKVEHDQQHLIVSACLQRRKLADRCRRMLVAWWARARLCPMKVNWAQRCSKWHSQRVVLQLQLLKQTVWCAWRESLTSALRQDLQVLSCPQVFKISTPKAGGFKAGGSGKTASFECTGDAETLCRSDLASDDVRRDNKKDAMQFGTGVRLPDLQQHIENSSPALMTFRSCSSGSETEIYSSELSFDLNPIDKKPTSKDNIKIVIPSRHCFILDVFVAWTEVVLQLREHRTLARLEAEHQRLREACNVTSSKSPVAPDWGSPLAPPSLAVPSSMQVRAAYLDEWASGSMEDQPLDWGSCLDDALLERCRSSFRCAQSAPSVGQTSHDASILGSKSPWRRWLSYDKPGLGITTSK